MNQKFAKYHGAGNDFILIEDPESSFASRFGDQISSLCHRRRGIGADGLILLQPSSCADFKMQIFNADGSEPAMCGNGLRCLVHFATERGWVHSSTCTIQTRAGLFTAECVAGRVILFFPQPRLTLANTLSYGHNVTVFDAGVPHAIISISHLSSFDLNTVGSQIRFDPQFAPSGVNVTCVEKKDRLIVRTYERGVEGETEACGTGIIAAAAYARMSWQLPSPLTLTTLSGDLFSVSWEEGQIRFDGPTTYLFEGELPSLVDKSSLGHAEGICPPTFLKPISR